MLKPLKILLSIPLLFCASAQADEFTALPCKSDIAKALIGKREATGPVAAIEAKHADLALKHLGADIVSDHMNTIGWEICGRAFLVLDKRNVIADVIEFPAHSRAAPAFSGSCQEKGRKSDATFVGVLDGAATGDMLPAKAAWRIDEKAAKFVKVDTSDLLCARSGIHTSDGGT
jgi:hypothetical protein